MMKRVKVKIPAGIRDENLAEMFNQMLGTGTVNMTIAYPRYGRIRGTLEGLVKLFALFRDSPLFTIKTIGPDGTPITTINPTYAAPIAEIDRFLAKSREDIRTMFSMDLSNLVHIEQVNAEQRKEFSDLYTQSKKSDIVNTFVILCDKLVVYKSYIANVNTLDHKFITCMPGASWTPFPFTSLNVKALIDSIMFLPTTSSREMMHQAELNVKYVMIVLNKAYQLSHNLWEEITSPDIDVAQFSAVIMSNIETIQRHPKLACCDLAFKRIKNSIELLQTNFGSYYRDFVATKDSTSMMQNFILDVSKDMSGGSSSSNNKDSKKSGAKVMRQFQQIITYYREVAGQQIKDPKVKQLFERVDTSLRELERGTVNLGRGGTVAEDVADVASSST